METSWKILVADRNPHIRKFLKRELAAAGYNVWIAENAKELLKHVYGHKQINLLVLDPDFPGIDATDLYQKLAVQLPQLSVVLHGISRTDDHFDGAGNSVLRIEKNGSSVEVLKQTIRDILTDIDRSGHRPPAQ
jgi:CheY-like chemotaxis protein